MSGGRFKLVLVAALSALFAGPSGCVFVSGSINPFARGTEPLEEHTVAGEGRDKILLLDISQVISDEEQQTAFGFKRRESTVARVEEELRHAAGDDRVKAVILRINSPGGTVTASDVVYHRLMSFKADRGLPLVAQMMDVATSGGYYVALAADEIVASPTTVTGSIGVVLYGFNLEGLLAKVGVTNQTIKSGTHKDIGSPLRRMTAEESAIMQSVLDEMQSRFVGLVRQRRPRFDGAAAALDGRILTAGQALEAKLVDRIGYLDDAVTAARTRAQLGQARVVMYRRPGEYAHNIYSRAAVAGGGVQFNLLHLETGGLLSGGPRFMYLWLPFGE
ncbi:MAG: signal peptide peptidase SppA [Deltaproteobacteria bacterium]|nr:signal peptide peptidase SppA [Deltaproteobacteria bacterium]